MNPVEITKDFGKGVLKGTVNEIVDTGVEKTHFDHNGLNNSNKAVRGLSGFAVEGTKGAVEGVPNRMIDNLDEVRKGNMTLDEAVDDAFDTKKIAEDYIKDGTEGAADQVYGNAVNGKEVSLDDLQDKKIRSKIPTDVISDPEKWIKNGGSIHMDSKGEVTFESRDMKVHNTQYKEPTDKIYYDDKGKVDYDRSTIDDTQSQVGGHMSQSKK